MLIQLRIHYIFYSQQTVKLRLLRECGNITLCLDLRKNEGIFIDSIHAYAKMFKK